MTAKSHLKKHLIVPAAGTGSRLDSTIPKQFIPLAGKPMLMHTMEAFGEAIPDLDIIVVLPEDHIDLWKSLCDDFAFHLRHRITIGGPTRFHSVKNGVESIHDEEGLVGIHDGARPFVEKKLILQSFSAAEEHGAAIPVIPLTDSIRRLSNDGQSIMVNRDEYRAIQTPQCFRLNVLRDAYSRIAQDDSLTDDASVVERAGYKVHLVMGDPENFKVTTPLDLNLAEMILTRFRKR